MIKMRSDTALPNRIGLRYGLFAFQVVSLALLMISTVVSFATAGDTAAEFSAEDLEFFESKVRPLLVDHCYECHGPATDEPAGGLSMASRPALLKGGDTGPAIDKEHPDKSLLLDAINYGDIYEMPPDSKLPAAEIATLTKWVRMGSPWPKTDDQAAGKGSAKKFDLAARKAEHWCWQPIQNASVPVVKDESWPRDAVDHFVLAKLEEAGLTPAEPADRRMLIRRLSFDLLGLPPTPEQIDEFVSDQSDDALPKLVDRLLASPHFGERWGRHWLDLARYAETHGHEFDYPIPHAHEYRDYVIRALNEDVPYNDFVREHLAGDLLPNPRLHPVDKFNESVIGPGFFWLGEGTHAPVDVKGDQAARIDNQIDVLCKSFLGLTVACARCHDHKFDAISTEDYYSMSGYLQSSRRHFAQLDVAGKEAALVEQIDEKQVSADKSLSNVIESLANLDPSQLACLAKGLADSAKNAGDEDSPLKSPSHPLHCLSLFADKPTEKGQAGAREKWKKLRRQVVRSWQQWFEVGSGDSPLRKSSRILFARFDQGLPEGWSTSASAWSACEGVRAAAVRNISEEAPKDVSGNEPKHAPDVIWSDAVRSGVISSGLGGSNQKGVLRSPNFTISHDRVHVLARGDKCKIRIVIDGYWLYEANALLFKKCFTNLDDASQYKWYQLAGDLRKYHGHRAYLEVIDHADGCADVAEVRFANKDPLPTFSPFTYLLIDRPLEEIDSDKSLFDVVARTIRDLSAGIESDTSPNNSWLLRRDYATVVSYLIKHDLLPESKDVAALQTARGEIAALDAKMPTARFALSMRDGTPIDEHIFIRGNHKTPGSLAPRGILTAIDDGASRHDPAHATGSGRLQFAERIVSEQNPLTARVAVNRIWHHLFGRGIVESVDNFGVLGQKPTHPELLDYLASEFMDDGWSTKRMIRRLVLSQTYQMSSRANSPAEKVEVVDAENLLLHRARIRRLQGEAIRDSILAVSGQLDQSQYGASVPVHLTSFMTGRGRPGKSGPLDGDRRRSVYLEVRRNFLSPMMLAFDTPIPFNAIGRRNVSNVPAQSLILMNDPFVAQQSKLWAERIVKTGDSFEERLANAWIQAFGRPPTERETQKAVEYMELFAKELGVRDGGVGDRVKLWKELCHVIFNMKEFIYLQ